MASLSELLWPEDDKIVIIATYESEDSRPSVLVHKLDSDDLLLSELKSIFENWLDPTEYELHSTLDEESADIEIRSYSNHGSHIDNLYLTILGRINPLTLEALRARFPDPE
jgi:hypothetical protein